MEEGPHTTSSPTPFTSRSSKNVHLALTPPSWPHLRVPPSRLVASSQPPPPTTVGRPPCAIGTIYSGSL
eukprot:3302247-Pleurochrysis_carterae.AAC.1